jgi:hypothetical protein
MTSGAPADLFLESPPGREDEFNTRYSGHLALICGPEGVPGASRYRISGTRLPGQLADGDDYLRVYNLDDPEATIPRMPAHQRESIDVVDPGSSGPSWSNTWWPK